MLLSLEIAFDCPHTMQRGPCKATRSGPLVTLLEEMCQPLNCRGAADTATGPYATEWVWC